MTKKILVVSPSLKLGGIERALTVLANHFAQIGHDITFLNCLGGTPFYQLDSRVKLIVNPRQSGQGIFAKISFYLYLLFFIRSSVRRISPDVVLVFGDVFSPLTLLALYWKRIPIYISDRTSPDYDFKFPIPLLKNWLYPRARGFIAQTLRAADYKKKQFGASFSTSVIPNAIRTIKAQDVQRKQVILYVGRFAWEKAPDRLINAFALLEDKQGWTLQMAGTGPLLVEMKQLVVKLGIRDSVDFLGQVTDIDRLLSEASIYVLPSVLEGFPNALCEAMSAGLPVVCFNAIPHEDLLKHGESGIVIDDGNILGLRDTLLFLMGNKKERERLGRNARLKSKDFDIGEISNLILEYLSSTGI